MKMKKILILSAMLMAMASCQRAVIERELYGKLTLSLENSPIVESVTKADDAAVSTDDFSVFVSSDDATFSYIYKDMPSVVTLPVGDYIVSAENVSESVSLSQPDKWGQVRYAGTSAPVTVSAGLNPTSVSLTCKMVNTAVSVVFGENIDKHFTDYKITAYTVDTRKLEYTPSNTVGENPVVGYFNGGITLNYVFSGTYILENEPMTIVGSKVLQPATHLHLTFKMSEQNGTVGKPEIIVDATCTDLYETITVDPSEGGSFVTEQI